MSKKTKDLKILAASAGICGVLYLAVGTVLTHAVLGRGVYENAHKRNTERMNRPDADEQTCIRREKNEWYNNIGKESVVINNREGKPIHAKIITAPNETDVFVVCIHGYTSEPIEMSTYAYEFYNMGYNILLPDMRGHADSEFKFIGMGWPDRFDIIDWIYYIIDKNPNAKIILHGVSMGGATVMMTTGENLPFNVKCAVEDCGYTNVWDEFTDVMKHRYKIPKAPASVLLKSASSVANKLAGYRFKDASSIEQLKKSKTPTLFIHGTADTFVPFSMLDVVYEAAACEKQKLEIPGAKHANSHLVNPELYWNTVKEFINKYI